MRVQLWSYNYEPEPTGIGPVSKILAQGLVARGHDVLVVSAHPHYPERAWGTRIVPYRERRNGIPVIRLPLWIGRDSASQRLRQEFSFMLAQSCAVPLLPKPEILISASPSFPALLPAIANVRARQIPWILWLQDILPDGATTTGLVHEGPVLSTARWLERVAYSLADRIVVLSRSFTANLTSKAVPSHKIKLIYNPATRTPIVEPSFTGVEPSFASGCRVPLRVLSMGNIGFSQGLAPLVGALEQSSGADDAQIELVITGSGVAAADVAAQIVSDRVKMLGVVDDQRLEDELRRADIALVTQLYDGTDFNIPSKLMNFMAYGLPILAAVNPRGEVARIVREADAGWVVDSSNPGLFPAKLLELVRERQDIEPRGRAALSYALQHFTQDRFAEAFEQELLNVVAARKRS